MKFTQLVPAREAMVAAAPAELPKADFSVNILAAALHPDKQYLKVAEIKEWDENCRTYTLVPDPDRGTEKCAFFKAGQYLSVFLDIDGMPVTRAYTISSSPKEALEGAYRLTIKYVTDGLVSRYILDNWEVGSEVTVSGPSGAFDYSPLRDAGKVIALAGGSGITPFLSFAKAISEGDEDFELTILYGSRTAADILFKDELEAIAAACPKVKLVYVLSDEPAEGCESGFITADLIKKYAPADEAYSVFVCGPAAMYEFARGEVDKLGIERKYARFEVAGEIFDPTIREDYPGCDAESVSITVKIRDKEQTVTGNPHETILRTLEKNGIAVPTRCRSGMCGFCHSQLVSGNVYVPKDMDGRRMGDLTFGYIHPCCSFPLSDIVIDVPPAK